MRNVSLQDKIWLVVATLFGIGYAPFLGGTLASILGMGVFLLFKSKISFFLFTLGAVVFAFVSSSIAEINFARKDPREIVIDDFSGMLVGLLFLPPHPGLIIAAFILFRFFDAFKIYPIDRIEKLKGALGVVGDDLMAGVYTAIVIHTFRLLLKISS